MNITVTLTREQARDVHSALTRELNYFHTVDELKAPKYAQTKKNLEESKRIILAELINNPDFEDEKHGEVFE